jgi:hypothetical protein
LSRSASQRYESRNPTEAAWWCAMSKDVIGIGIVIVVIGMLAMWMASHGPFNNMGFDSSWDCPPNATRASTVCIKKPSSPKP